MASERQRVGTMTPHNKSTQRLKLAGWRFTSICFISTWLRVIVASHALQTTLALLMDMLSTAGGGGDQKFGIVCAVADVTNRQIAMEKKREESQAFAQEAASPGQGAPA